MACRGPGARLMPIFEFSCLGCGERFEELVRAGERPPCPRCGGADAERLYSPVSPPARIGLRGREARRSDATRRAREELRRERAAERRAPRTE